MPEYKVTMRKSIPGWDHEASCNVPEDQLADFVADARTRWDSVDISETPIT